MFAEKHITLSQLQCDIRSALEERFALPVWVSAEISDVKVNYSGHCYIDLVEKADGGADGVPRAQARAVIWRSRYAAVVGRFEAESGQPLAAGMKVLVKAVVSYHELYGLSLQIIDMDASYMLGDMERQRRETIARLQSDGVWDMNRTIEIPTLVQRIAVVSSANAAGYRDFCREIAASGYSVRTELFDAFMQGAAAEESVIDALCRVAARETQFDAVAVIRGGGAVSDLNCFNSYRLCSHIAQFPLPVITGIGHDKDVSVADMVAAVALKTPTAVAGWVVERMARADASLDDLKRAIVDAAVKRLAAERLRMNRCENDLRLNVMALSRERHARLASFSERLRLGAEHLLAVQKTRLDAASALVDSRRPEQVMRLGFSIVRSGGRTVVSVGQLSAGVEVHVSVADGEFTARVKDTIKR